MRRLFLIILLIFSAQSFAQPNPWNTVAPSGSQVYMDIKDAAKNVTVAYRLQLDGSVIVNDKKQMSRLPSLTSLMALRLNNNGFTKLPSTFLALHGLIYFSSTGNALTTLPDSIGLWSNLKFIELGQTAFDTIPEGIFGLSRLQSLSINANTDTLCFTSSVRFFSKTFVELRLYNSCIDTLPDEFSTLSQLQKLVMYKCKMDGVPKQLYSMTHLGELWLDSNNIVLLPPAIARMEGLTYLSLRGNKISRIPSNICFLKELVVLDLRGNPLDPYDVQVVQALLPNCRVLF